VALTFLGEIQFERSDFLQCIETSKTVIDSCCLKKHAPIFWFQSQAIMVAALCKCMEGTGTTDPEIYQTQSHKALNILLTYWSWFIKSRTGRRRLTYYVFIAKCYAHTKQFEQAKSILSLLLKQKIVQEDKPLTIMISKIDALLPKD
jgi:hypothetical protein